MSTMTMTGNTGREPPGDNPNDPSVVIHTTHVRFAIAQKDASNTVPIPSIMHKIMNKIRDHDNKAIFNDIENKIISMEEFPVDKEIFDKAFATIVPKKTQPPSHRWIHHQLCTSFRIYQVGTSPPAPAPACIHAPPIKAPLGKASMIYPSHIFTRSTLPSPICTTICSFFLHTRGTRTFGGPIVSSVSAES
jgi:hypothetical protein